MELNLKLLRTGMAAAIVAGIVATLTLLTPAQDLVQASRTDGAQTPLRVYTPSTPGCAPLALISPGAGSNENGYRYLAEALRDDGWRAIVMGHKESGMAALRSDMREAHGLHKGLAELVNDPKAYNARLMDIAAALEWANSSCKAPFVALVGHSMGARTVEVEAGTKNNFGVKGLDRFDAYVALSPDGPGAMFPENAWSGIRKPDADADGHARWLPRRRLENAHDSL